jgi:primosomal protein N'
VVYHARDMAVVRGRIEKAAVVLASATPSIETRVNAQQGRYKHLKLESRFGGRHWSGGSDPLVRFEVAEETTSSCGSLAKARRRVESQRQPPEMKAFWRGTR